MKMIVAAVGSLKDRGLQSLVDDYVLRASRRVPLNIVEVKNSAALIKAVPKGYVQIALDERGKLVTTRELAAVLDKMMQTAVPGAAWLIGGAHGLDDKVKSGSDLMLSLSPMTFPHRLARVVLCEQLYRALSIIYGEPYHK